MLLQAVVVAIRFGGGRQYWGRSGLWWEIQRAAKLWHASIGSQELQCIVELHFAYGSTVGRTY